MWVLRDLMGCVSLLSAPEEEKEPLLRLAEIFHRNLEAHAYSPDRAILVMEQEEREALKSESVSVKEGDVTVYLVDREITGRRWATVSEMPGPPRFVLFGLKGGLGRSTTGAVLAAHLARKGHRVLVMDFDLESPALSSMLEPAEHPDFGIVEWLVEDLVDQGDAVLEGMAGQPGWSVET
ncbi:MAG: P-loop NTPase, partial [Anaerolineae bacterium]